MGSIVTTSVQSLDQALKADPARTQGLTGVFAFVIGDEGFWIEAKDGTGAVHEGAPAQADLTVRMSEQVFADIGSGKLNGAEAFVDGLMTVEGDESKMLFLGQLFGE